MFGDFGARRLHAFLLHNEPDVPTLFVARMVQELSGAKHEPNAARHRTLGHRRPFSSVALGVVNQQAIVFLFSFAAFAKTRIHAKIQNQLTYFKLILLQKI